MVTFGSYTIIIKPALTVFAAAVTIGLIAPPIVHLLKFEKSHSYGYVNPDMWRFDTRGTADARIMLLDTDGGEIAPMPTKGAPTYNSDQGFNVTVFHPGKATDTVFLRNAMSLGQSDSWGKDLHLSFEAKADRLFPLLFTVRDGHPGMDKEGPIWSYEMKVRGSWKKYDVTIPAASLQKTANLDSILAIHLGTQSGNVGFRHIYVR